MVIVGGWGRPQGGGEKYCLQVGLDRLQKTIAEILVAR